MDAGKSRHPELVDYFALDGSWWLPDSPDHRVSGTLTFNAEGLALVAYGSLVPTVRVPNAVLEQTVPDWEETTVIPAAPTAARKSRFSAQVGRTSSDHMSPRATIAFVLH